MLNLAETRRDPRVRRVAKSLADAGARVVVVGPTWESTVAHEHLDGYELMRIEGPRRTSAELMRAVERTSPALAAIVRRVDPELLDEESSRAAHLLFRAHRKVKNVLAAERKKRPALEARLDPVDRALGQVDRLFADRSAMHGLRSTLLMNLALFERAKALEPDVVHANDLTTLPAAFLLKEALGIPLVYDAHEIYAEQFAPTERHERWHHFYTALERELFPATDGRLTVCDSIAEYFVRERGAGPVLTIRNVPSIAKLPPPAILERRNAPRLIGYHGNYLKHRGLEELIRAAQHVEGARIVMRGFGAHEPALRALAASEGVLGRQLDFARPVPMTELIASAAEGDVGLSLLLPVSLNMSYALPNKFFEYMMGGLALAISDTVEMRRVVEREDIGVVLPSLEPEPLGRALSALVADTDALDARRRRAYAAARDVYNWEEEERRLLAYYRPLAGL